MADNINIADAILVLDSNAKVKVSQNSYDKITWYDGNPNNITVDQIKVEVAKLQTVFDNLEYQRQREKAYEELGSWKDQLDMIYHDIDAWKTEVKKIKDKYPKS